VRTGRDTAGPSTALRSGRDDNSVAWKRAQKWSDEWLLIVQQNCHPDRSAAQWRDLLSLFRFSRRLCGLVRRNRNPEFAPNDKKGVERCGIPLKPKPGLNGAPSLRCRFSFLFSSDDLERELQLSLQLERTPGNGNQFDVVVSLVQGEITGGPYHRPE
jgi:hypothetical protein